MWRRIHCPSCSAYHNMSSPLINHPTHEHSFNYERNINLYQHGPLTTSAGNFVSLIIHLDFIKSIISGIERLVFVSNVSHLWNARVLSHSRWLLQFLSFCEAKHDFKWHLLRKLMLTLGASPCISAMGWTCYLCNCIWRCKLEGIVYICMPGCKLW